MKTRLGFVSNSSSSSFLMYGIYLNNELAKKLDVDLNKIDLYDLCGKTLDYHCPYEGDYIGVSFGAIKDDETGAQFKERVFQELKSRFPKLEKTDCHILEQAWMNG